MHRAAGIVSATAVAVAALLGSQALPAASPGMKADLVTVRRDGLAVELRGRVVAASANGQVLVETPDGAMWDADSRDVAPRSDLEPFAYLDKEALARHILAELPRGFDVHYTQHYVICHDTSRAYAAWCGGMLEQVYRVFANYWRRRGIELHPPAHPLAAVVYSNKQSYIRHARKETGDAAESIVGYYSLRTNRVTTFDLTSVQSLLTPSDRRGSHRQIQAMLARPEAERLVATMIHEATHQIAFNSGLHARYADIPLWVSEGLAVYFETPDLRSRKARGQAGAVNPVRLATFRGYLARRPRNSLQSLLAGDDRFRDIGQTQDAYAEAWALHYFLSRTRSVAYTDWMRTLSQKRPLVTADAATRLREFKRHFGHDLAKLDADFVKYMAETE